MVEYHKVERLLNLVRPEFAHVVVITVVEKVDAEGVLVANAFDLLAENGLCFVIAVTVRTVDLRAVKPMNFAIGCSRLP